MVILLTLLGQGLTLPYLITRSKLYNGLMDESNELAKQTMKQGLKQHVYQFLKTNYDNERSGQVGMEKFIKQWEERAKAGDTD